MPVRLRAPAPVRVVWDGQSQLRSPVGGPFVPDLAMRGSGVPWANVSVSGVGWDVDASGGPGLSSTAQTRLFPQARTGTDVLVLCGGQSDAMWSSEIDAPDPAQIAYDATVTYTTAARAAGFDTVICCTWPSIHPAYEGWPALFAAYGDLVQASPGPWDAVVDLHVGDLADGTSAAFIFDGIHLSAHGARLAAALIRPVLADYL